MMCAEMIGKVLRRLSVAADIMVVAADMMEVMLVLIKPCIHLFAFWDLMVAMMTALKEMGQLIRLLAMMTRHTECLLGVDEGYP